MKSKLCLVSINSECWWSSTNEFIAIRKYDHVFAGNGLVAFKDRKQLFEEVIFYSDGRDFLLIVLIHSLRRFQNISAMKTDKHFSTIVGNISRKVVYPWKDFHWSFYRSHLHRIILRGTFIEFRNGLINVSPVGRNWTKEERDAFEAYDLLCLTSDQLLKTETSHSKSNGQRSGREINWHGSRLFHR